MTTNRRPTDDRDDVLYAFHQACPAPTAADIIQWCELYPQFAEDIRDHAAVSRDWAARKQPAEVEVNETELARGFSQVLNLIYQADHAASAPSGATAIQTFQNAMAARCTTLPQLARELDIGRSVLSALFNGRMRAPVGHRLKVALIHALDYTEAAFDDAIRWATTHPQVGLAKSSSVPTVGVQSYEDVVRSSDMSPQRKHYWLGED